MDQRTSSVKETRPGNLKIVGRNREEPCTDTQEEGETTLALGESFVKTIRHIFPRMNETVRETTLVTSQEFTKYRSNASISWLLAHREYHAIS